MRDKKKEEKRGGSVGETGVKKKERARRVLSSTSDAPGRLEGLTERERGG